MLQPVDVDAKPRQRITLAVVQSGVFQVRKAEAHPRQRCTYFVRHRLGQHALAFQQQLQLFGHVVERLGQRPHQRGTGARRTAVELAIAHPSRGLRQLRDITPQPVDHHIHRQRHRHHQDQQDDGHAGGLAVLPAFFGQGLVQRPQDQRTAAVADALQAAHAVQLDLHVSVEQALALFRRQYRGSLGQRQQLQRIGEIAVQLLCQGWPLRRWRFGEAMLQHRMGAAHFRLQAGLGAVFQQRIPGPQPEHDQQQMGGEETDAVAQEVEGMATHGRRRMLHPHADRLNR
ncbi:hypothetical protein D3C72_1454250 [compost metagenome]